ncbi:MAG: ankyrin repeat domain-containing protein, partial [Cyanobacteria bacterium]|nr:ankyrin repeat domain-containing protein [Cyanobacteriota bacterium]
QRVEQLIQSGFDMNTVHLQPRSSLPPFPDGDDKLDKLLESYTFLLRAIDLHDEESVYKLLNAGANPNLLGRMGDLNSYPLNCAIDTQKSLLVKALVEAGANVNEIDDYADNSMLHKALDIKNSEIFNILLNPPPQFPQPDLTSQDRYGKTLLYNAIKTSQFDLAEMLIHKGAPVVPSSNLGSDDLVKLAANKLNSKLCRLLIEKGAPLTESQEARLTPIHAAINARNVEDLKFFLSKGFSLDNPSNPKNILTNPKDILSFAMEMGDIPTIQFIFEKGLASPQKDYYQKNALGLLLANRTEDSLFLPLVKMLVEHGADVWHQDSTGESPFSMALRNCEAPVVDFLMTQEGISSCSKKDLESLFLMASETGHLPLLKVIMGEYKLKNLQSGSDTLHPLFSIQDSNGCTPFLIAIKKGSLDIAQWLVSQGATLEDVDFEGNNALHLAVKGSYASTPDSEGLDSKSVEDQHNKIPLLFKWVFENIKLPRSPLDQRLYAQNKAGLAPIHEATLQENSNRKPSIVSFLLAQGDSLEHPDHKGLTPLHLLADLPDSTSASFMLSWLVENGANLEAKDQNGNTALHHAKHSIEFLKALLAAGANPNAVNGNGLSFLEDQVLKNRSKFVDILENAGAIHTPFSEHLKAWIELHHNLLLHRAEVRQRKNWNVGDPVFDSFIQVMPKLLTLHPNYWVPFLKQLEKVYDTYSGLQGFHPNEAELLLLVKHPDFYDASGKGEQYLSSLTTALTSISHFIDTGAELTDETLQAWGNVGFLTHAFRFWRYDTVGGEKSLLAQFGFKTAPEGRPLDDVFGKGFLLEEPRSGAQIEFRRGYLLVSQPGLGTLVIRNSSTVFGRNLLKHPGYYLPKVLKKEEVLAFDPRTLPDTANILHRDLYEYDPNSEDGPTPNGKWIWYLTQTLLKVKDEYRKFKLDTEAFGAKGQFTGHLSPGLPKMISFLNGLKSQGKPLPDLAFTHPDFPISQPYAYGEDALGNSVHRFKLTPSALKELNDFVSGHWSEEKYPQSDWIRFIQQAGVENRGELVMLEAEKLKATP